MELLNENNARNGYRTSISRRCYSPGTYSSLDRPESVMCLRGSRSSRGCPAVPAVGEGDIELALIEGRVGQ